MRRRIRHVRRLLGDVIAGFAQTGRWWPVALLIVVLVAVVVGTTAAAVVPSAVYVFI